MFSSNCFILVLSVVGVGFAKELPSYIKKCKLDSPNLNECVDQALRDMIPYLENGVPEMKIPSIKPFKISKVSLENGKGFAATFENVHISGIESTQVRAFDLDLEKGTAFLEIFIPKLRLEGTYTFHGKLIIFELSGKGPADINITDVGSTTRASAKIVTKQGKDYILFSDRQRSLKIDHASVRFENLFKGNHELTDHTNDIINQNIRDIMKDLKPGIQVAISNVVDTYIDKVFNDYSVDELFQK